MSSHALTWVFLQFKIHNLTDGEKLVLIALGDSPSNQQDVADKLVLPLDAVSRMFINLEKKGLISQITNRGDGKTVFNVNAGY